MQCHFICTSLQKNHTEGDYFNECLLFPYLSAAHDYPIYGTQWHPEKNAFEWTRPYIPHSSSAVKTTFYMAEFFVSEGMHMALFLVLSLIGSCTIEALWSVNLNAFLISVLTARKNLHRFESEEDESKALIYNYNPVYAGPKSGFQQIYYFWFILMSVCRVLSQSVLSQSRDFRVFADNDLFDFTFAAHSICWICNKTRSKLEIGWRFIYAT